MIFENVIELAFYPIIAIIIAQSLKVILQSGNGKISVRSFNAYGAMPSGHTAYVTAVTMQIFLMEGFSTAFAVAFVLTIITIRDAVGFRWHLAQHAAALNQIIRELKPHSKKTVPRVEEQLGHTLPQVAVGAVIGIATILVLNTAF